MKHKHYIIKNVINFYENKIHQISRLKLIFGENIIAPSEIYRQKIFVYLAASFISEKQN